MQEKVLELFKKLKIDYQLVEHPPLFTCADHDKYGIKIDGLDCKNLFLRNKEKSQYYLVSLPSEKRLDQNKLQKTLGESRLSFGNESVLFEKLGIKSGSASLLNVINTKNSDVIFIVDKELSGHSKVGFHPNVNTATVLFNPKNIEKIFNHHKAKYVFLEL